MSFPRYPEYKDSGAEWLGEVPAHWSVDPLKRNLRLLTDKANARTNPVALENIESWTGRYIPTDTEFEGDGVAFRSGDILFGKLRPYLAKAIVAQKDGEAVGDFHVMRPLPNILPRFALYEILTREFIGIIDGSTFGSKMPRASWEFVGAMAMPRPPLEEQEQVVRFLDRETSTIDSLIEEQGRLITLLKEKRQAVISHAVTKGLDPNVPMKDSGIEWLGQVPAHWEVLRLGDVSKEIQTGPFGSQLHAEDYIEGGVPVVNPSNLQAGVIVPDWSSSVSSQVAERLFQHKLFVGDIVFGRRGEMGRCARVTEFEAGWLCGTGSLRVRLVARAVPIYILRFLQSSYVKEWLGLESVGSTMDNLNTSILSRLPLPLPPVDEQAEIARRVDLLERQADALVSEAERGTELLRERRAALISAAVTGKIDVRKNENAFA